MHVIKVFELHTSKCRLLKLLIQLYMNPDENRDFLFVVNA